MSSPNLLTLASSNFIWKVNVLTSAATLYIWGNSPVDLITTPSIGGIYLACAPSRNNNPLHVKCYLSRNWVRFYVSCFQLGFPQGVRFYGNNFFLFPSVNELKTMICLRTCWLCTTLSPCFVNLTLMSYMASSLRVWSQNFQTATQLCDEIWALALRYDPDFKDVLPLIKKNATWKTFVVTK